MNNLKIKKVFVSLLMFVVIMPAFSANSDFPNRKLYPTLTYIELGDFEKTYKDVIVVDVRSKYEYDTLHIKNALNFSRAKPDFVKNMEKLRSANKSKTIVLYCNGRTCEQSYKAGKKCWDHKIKNILVYDGGIFEFSTANPKLAVLVGKKMGTADRLISKSKLEEHFIDYKMFVQILNTRNSLVLDVRDKLQRDGVALFIGKEKRASLGDGKKLAKYINEAKINNKTLLIYDNAGKQVRWLQYYLEDKGVASYYFMKGGARKYIGDLRKAFSASH